MEGWLQEGCSERCLLSLSCHTCHQLPPSCSRIQAVSGHFVRACICLLPQVFSWIELHHQNCSNNSFFSMSSSTGCCWGSQVGGRPPRCPSHPSLEALSCSFPTADMGHFSMLLVFGLCNFPGTAVSSHKEYKDFRALGIYVLYYEP